MKNLYVVLEDGETFTSIDDCVIVETTPEGEEALEECSDHFFRDAVGEDEDGNKVLHIKKRWNIKALLEAYEVVEEVLRQQEQMVKETKTNETEITFSDDTIFSLSEDETEKKEMN